MSTDVWIAFGIGIAQLITTIYGVIVSLNDKRLKAAVTLGLVGGAGVLLTAVAALRNDRAQQGLQSQLDKIQHNTERPQPAPNVIVNPPQVNFPTTPQRAILTVDKFQTSYLTQERTPILLLTGKPISQNISFQNTGDAIADDLDGFGKAYIVPSTMSEKEVIAKFKSELSQRKPRRGGMLQTGEQRLWFTVTSDEIVTQEIESNLRNNSLHVYVLAFQSWKDPTGSHYIHFCWLLQPPEPSEVEPVWHLCRGFSEHR